MIHPILPATGGPEQSETNPNEGFSLLLALALAGTQPGGQPALPGEPSTAFAGQATVPVQPSGSPVPGEDRPPAPAGVIQQLPTPKTATASPGIPGLSPASPEANGKLATAAAAEGVPPAVSALVGEPATPAVTDPGTGQRGTSPAPSSQPVPVDPPPGASPMSASPDPTTGTSPTSPGRAMPIAAGEPVTPPQPASPGENSTPLSRVAPPASVSDARSEGGTPPLEGEATPPASLSAEPSPAPAGEAHTTRSPDGPGRATAVLVERIVRWAEESDAVSPRSLTLRVEQLDDARLTVTLRNGTVVLQANGGDQVGTAQLLREAAAALGARGFDVAGEDAGRREQRTPHEPPPPSDQSPRRRRPAGDGALRL